MISLNKKLKIALISTPYITIPPTGYGGLERVVGNLADELVKKGHDVTLFAPGDSTTTAKLFSFYPKENWSYKANIAQMSMSLKEIKKQGDFDIIHSNFIDFIVMGDLIDVPMVTTMHNTYVDYFENDAFQKSGCEMLAISHDQADTVRKLGTEVTDVVYNGIPLPKFNSDLKKENYLAFIGRFCAEKGVHHAIEAALKTDIPLKLAGNIYDEAYFNEYVKPHIDSKAVEWVGVLNDAQKYEFLGKAKGMLFPITWDEPFGLVTVESLASGTPVIAFERIITKELLVDGEVGYLVKNVDEMVEKIHELDKICPVKCREYAKKFSVETMADEYLTHYYRIIAPSIQDLENLIENGNRYIAANRIKRLLTNEIPETENYFELRRLLEECEKPTKLKNLKDIIDKIPVHTGEQISNDVVLSDYWTSASALVFINENDWPDERYAFYLFLAYTYLRADRLNDFYRVLLNTHQVYPYYRHPFLIMMEQAFNHQDWTAIYDLGRLALTITQQTAYFIEEKRAWDTIAIHDYLSLGCYFLGKISEGREYFEICLSREPDNHRLLENKHFFAPIEIKKLKIAVISTPYVETPPKKYGGTERVASVITEELVKRGHDVTLFATGDSKTSAKLVSYFDKPNFNYYHGICHMVSALKDIEDAGDFDIIHNHNPLLTTLFERTKNTPMVTTLHSDQDYTYATEEFKNRGYHYCAISHDQAMRMRNWGMKIDHVVYNGLNFSNIPNSLPKEEYLVFLGDIYERKGTHIAVEAAVEAGIKLKIAGKVTEPRLFDDKIRPFIESGHVEFIGEVNEQEKLDLLSKALGTLFPVTIAEPFGLVLIESLACGTPVIAFDNGSPKEIIIHGKTGFLVDHVGEMIEKIKELKNINPDDCKVHAQKFNIRNMVDSYLEVYNKVIDFETLKKNETLEISNPKISVIIPVYQGEKWLNSCLDSIVDQTFKDFEVIIVNDGSTDNSLELINNYRDKLTNLIVHTQDNQGIIRATEKAISLINGDYVLFIDQDDFIAFDTLEKLYNAATINNVETVQYNFNVFYSDETYTPIICNHFTTALWTQLIKKEILQKIEIEKVPSVNFAQDWVLTRLIELQSPSRYVLNEHLYFHREHYQSTSRQITEKNKKDIYTCYEFMHEVYVDTGDFEKHSRLLESWKHFILNIVDSDEEVVREFEKIEYKFSEPRVSVLIPAYNQIHYLEDAINSVINQTYRNIEIIISDNSTNDDVMNLVKSYQNKFDNIFYYDNRRDDLRGHVKNFQNCYEYATGKYVSYLLHDDLYHETRIEKMVDKFEKDSSLSMVASNRLIIDSDGLILEHKDAYNVDTYIEGFEVARQLLFEMDNHIGEPTTIMFVRKHLEKDDATGYFGDEQRFYTDIPLFLKLCAKGNVMFLNERLSSFRIHNEQTTSDMKTFRWLLFDYFYMIINSWENGLFIKDESELARAFAKWTPMYFIMSQYFDTGSIEKEHDYLQKVFNRLQNYEFAIGSKLVDKIKNSACFKNCVSFNDKISTQNIQKKYYLTICAIAREEARYLDEWIAYHVLKGVEKIYLRYEITSHDIDQAKEILNKWVQRDIVEVEYTDTAAMQTFYYHKTALKIKDDVHWCAFIDIDEFLWTKNDDETSLVKILKNYENEVDSAELDYVFFGNNDIIHDEEGLLIERFTRHQQITDRILLAPHEVKNILQFNERTISLIEKTDYLHCHLLLTEERIKRLGGNYQIFEPLGEVRLTEYYPLSEFCIAHYYCKSEAEFKAKCARPSANWTHKDRNFLVAQNVYNFRNRNDVSCHSLVKYKDVVLEEIAITKEMFNKSKHTLPGHLVVSLTSYPKRYHLLSRSLKSILNQSVLPDEIILWIANDDFESLPKEILSLQSSLFTIRTTKDIGSYKKIIPTLKLYPESFIITFDDDIEYDVDTIKSLVENFEVENIAPCRRAHILAFETTGTVKKYTQWPHDIKYEICADKVFSTGGAGTLYPPGIFHSEVTNEDLFLHIAPRADDIWLWFMVRLNNNKFKRIAGDFSLNLIDRSEVGSLWETNKNGGNDEQFEAMIKYFGLPLDNRSIKPGFNSATYWENRYKQGGNSGAGSYGRLAEFKAGVLNNFVEVNNVKSVIELGCGDGNQLSLSKYLQYKGFDISYESVRICKEKFITDDTKDFYHVSELGEITADLTLSLDVIFHLTEDEVFHKYMNDLFKASNKYVIIYSSNDNQDYNGSHVRHRKFSTWIENFAPDFIQIDKIVNLYPIKDDPMNESFADFYIFEKKKTIS